MTGLEQRVAGIKANYETCFGCGRRNDIGLQIGGFALADGGLTAQFSPRSDYRGYEDVLHGGILATALDEMLGWTAILLEDVMVVTAKLDLRFPKPAPVNERYRLTGTPRERRGRRLLLAGDCRTEAGTVVATATGLFLIAQELTAARAPQR